MSLGKLHNGSRRALSVQRQLSGIYRKSWRVIIRDSASVNRGRFSAGRCFFSSKLASPRDVCIFNQLIFRYRRSLHAKSFIGSIVDNFQQRRSASQEAETELCLDAFMFRHQIAFTPKCGTAGFIESSINIPVIGFYNFRSSYVSAYQCRVSFFILYLAGLYRGYIPFNADYFPPTLHLAGASLRMQTRALPSHPAELFRLLRRIREIEGEGSSDAPAKY